MKVHMLERKEKLFYKLADDFCKSDETETETSAGREREIKLDRTFMKGHKQAITCLEWTSEN